MLARHLAVAEVCKLIDADNLPGATELLQQEYPFTPVEAVERKYGDDQALKVFLRDGFIDRYSGAPLARIASWYRVALRRAG